MDPLSGKPHFPPPEGPLNGEPTFNPRRQLTALRTPTKLVPLPSPLPRSIYRSVPDFTQTHSLSVHILPAAFPRAPSTYGKLDVPDLEAFGGRDSVAKGKKQKWLRDTADKMFWQKDEADKLFPDPKAGVSVSDEGLWSTVLRIRRKAGKDNGRKGLTLVALHPIGFHKEIWEPTFKHLLEISESNPNFTPIEEIWSLEAIGHGDAGLLNSSHLPNLPDRSDYGRDLANFVINFLPEGSVAFGKDLPLSLSRVSSDISDNRIKNGFSDRSVIPVGHSLGGDAAVICALSYPKLFFNSALILLETTIFPPSNLKTNGKTQIFTVTLGRRSSWPSKQEARSALLKSPLFRAFDPTVFDAYMDHGLYENSITGQTELKCHPASEAGEFAEQRTMSEAWELLPTLPENIEIRWIMGGADEASNLVGGPHVARRTIWRRPTNSSNVKVAGAGHLIVQEKPKDVAEDIALFLSHKFGHSVHRNTHNPSKL